MSRDYEELDKTLIEIEEEIEEDSSEEEILPFIYEDKFKEIDSNLTVKDIYIQIRERLIKVIRGKFS